ncbi:MAG: M23 family metallopeptidase [Actinomycetes bacterium]
MSVLGVGVAGTVTLSGAAERTAAAPPAVETQIEPGVSVPSAFDREVVRASRAATRPALAARTLTAQAANRSERLEEARQAAAKKARALEAAERKKKRARAAARARDKDKASSAARGDGGATLPLTGGYRLAARFGDVGSWSRYHTGFDFSAPVGTSVHTPSAGVVTAAGSGQASGWAGTYVTVRHADGTSTLYAHLSGTRVAVGEQVAAGQAIGAVGLTGRTFGAHLHFEVYPAGVEPGDVYQAVDPEPWLRARGLTP